MNRAKKTIGVILAIIGMAMAIGTQDGCEHEMMSRSIGVALFILGPWLAESYDFNRKHNQPTNIKTKTAAKGQRPVRVR